MHCSINCWHLYIPLITSGSFTGSLMKALRFSGKLLPPWVKTFHYTCAVHTVTSQYVSCQKKKSVWKERQLLGAANWMQLINCLPLQNWSFWQFVWRGSNCFNIMSRKKDVCKGFTKCITPNVPVWPLCMCQHIITFLAIMWLFCWSQVLINWIRY